MHANGNRFGTSKDYFPDIKPRGPLSFSYCSIHVPFKYKDILYLLYVIVHLFNIYNNMKARIIGLIRRTRDFPQSLIDLLQGLEDVTFSDISLLQSQLWKWPTIVNPFFLIFKKFFTPTTNDLTNIHCLIESV